jgi:hypothetical protein
MKNLIRNILLEQLLIENRKQKLTDYWVSTLKKGKYSYKSEEDIRNEVDTVINYLSTYDPSTNNKYLGWFLKQVYDYGMSMFDSQMHEDVKYYNDNLNRITPEFLETLKGLQHLSVSYRVDEPKILKNPKDINSFSVKYSLNFFNKVLQDFKTKSQLKKEDEESKKVVKLYESPDVLVVSPLTVQSSCKYGAGTKWCTAAKEENAFDYYNKFSLLVYVIPKHPITPGTKLAIQIPFNQRTHGYDFNAFNERDELLPKSFDMYQLLMMYVRDKNNEPMARDCSEIEGSIWNYYFQREEEINS